MDNKKNFDLLIPSRRFGRTEIQIPILSLGGMRFQQSWKDLDLIEIEDSGQNNLEKILNKSIDYGLNHIETARHYGTSEAQLGLALKKIDHPNRIIQTKIPPNKDKQKFETELKLSFEKLGCKRIDLLAIHGINLPEHLHETLRPGGCLEVVRKWQERDKIGFVGFSTHGSTDLIVKAIESNAFDYVNLHWYFIKQDNSLALTAANKFDLGVFIISPTDKGGHLHTPPSRLLDLCQPLHPIVFNDLFCLSDPRIHTISVGLSNINDLDLHLYAVSLLESSNQILPPIINNLNNASLSSLGSEWISSWHIGLPSWESTPGNINIPILLWLHNLIKSWDMVDYAKDRYSLLGKGGHWFPGDNADKLDKEVNELDLRKVLNSSPWKDEIPEILRNLKHKLTGEKRNRLWSS